MDNDKDEIDIKRFEIGPGIKHAIIWLSIITSFGGGWYLRGQFTQGELAASDLSQLKGDIVAKAESQEQKAINTKKLEDRLDGKEYNKDCGDIRIKSFYN